MTGTKNFETVLLVTGSRDINSPQLTALKIAWLRSGLTKAKLAEKAGIQLVTLRNVFCGNNQCRKTLRNLEQAIGEPIFSTLEEFQAARRSRTVITPIKEKL